MTLLRRVGPGPLLFLGFWLLLLAGGRSRFLRDPGTFWHVRTGDLIRAGGFLRTDPYTFTFPGTWWVPYQWLGEVGMSVVHQVAGFDGLLAVATALIAGLFVWLTVRLLRTGVAPVAVLAVVGVALAAAASHFHVRPHIATMIGMAATAALLTDVEAGRAGLRRLWWLVPAYWVWANTHGGVLGGMASLGLVGAGWVVWRLVGMPSPITGWRQVMELGLIGVSVGLTAFVGPYGADLPKTWLLIMTFPHLPDIIQEHARMDPANPTAWPVLVLAVGYVVALAGVPVRDWRVSWLLPLFWAVQSYLRVRHAPLFAVTACVGLADLWPHTRWAARLAARRPDFYTPGGRPVRWGWAAWLTPVVCVAVALGLQAGGLRVPLVGKGWATLDPDYWPVDSAEVLRKYEPADPARGRFFTDYVDGGFVIYHAPGYRVFVDDRCEVFGDAWLVEFVGAGSGDAARAIPAWEARYGRFEFALTRIGTPFDDYFHDRPAEWELLHDGRVARFYRRR